MRLVCFLNDFCPGILVVEVNTANGVSLCLSERNYGYLKTHHNADIHPPWKLALTPRSRAARRLISSLAGARA